ncbi:hypothetical protein E2C01_034797 [Portunus trituberculatus]|uniref:Uncharacterized protein n=1 Tax=Portunus trituberculatus TaxID=210409 RepID=A0A5B7F2G2_PORTR|nr:hypothetical protein [Portunus trituberculatus]
MLREDPFHLLLLDGLVLDWLSPQEQQENRQGCEAEAALSTGKHSRLASTFRRGPLRWEGDP